MNEIIQTTSSSGALRPLPKLAIDIRPGTLEDVPFLDSLQKLHTKQVGWMPRAQFEGKIKLGHVLVAWAPRPCSAEEDEDTGGAPVPREEERVGYCIGNDQYFKRDDVGIIYQMNVVPGKQRGLIGATLLQAMFERSAYGCRLFCCWCAQDIAANKFWEAMGFVPLAFRSGSRTKGAKGTPRVHIFWQKRIRKDDVTTPWWFPSQTSAGSIREDRIVLPIPPGTHWSDAKPMILPGAELPVADCDLLEQTETPQVSASANRKTRTSAMTRRIADATPEKKSAEKQSKPVLTGTITFAAPKPATPEIEKAPLEHATVTKPKRPVKAKVKNDPRHVAAARELRDRWLEHVQQQPEALTPRGKYDVSRRIGERVTIEAIDSIALRGSISSQGLLEAA